MTQPLEPAAEPLRSAEARSDIARAVRSALGRYSIRQSDLADRLGASQQAVSRRLTGQSPFLAHELLVVADMCGISVGVLLDPPPPVDPPTTEHDPEPDQQ
jgi:transcriptional regulator with XRE-family HTH domain